MEKVRQREIKFRAIVIDDDGNRDLRYNCWPVRDKVFVEDGGFWMRYERVEQFTGLKDKNGKEIYESDVILVDGSKRTLVSWSEKFASFCVKNDTWMFQHWFGEAVNPAECEVIGNIYEHHHLLSQGEIKTELI